MFYRDGDKVYDDETGEEFKVVCTGFSDEFVVAYSEVYKLMMGVDYVGNPLFLFEDDSEELGVSSRLSLVIEKNKYVKLFNIFYVISNLTRESGRVVNHCNIVNMTYSEYRNN